MEEIWKTLIYQGKIYDRFEVSNMGNLRNVKTGTVYKQVVSKHGYKQVCVSLGSADNKRLFKLHKAVAETFIPNPDNKPQVNHIDGNKINNYIDNLEWVTNQENARHAWDNNLIDVNKITGANNVQSKLTKEDIEYIRANYAPGSKIFGTRALGRKFGVAHTTIIDIIHYKSYVNV